MKNHIKTYKDRKKSSKIEILMGFTYKGGWFNCLIGR